MTALRERLVVDGRSILGGAALGGLLGPAVWLAKFWLVEFLLSGEGGRRIGFALIGLPVLMENQLSVLIANFVVALLGAITGRALSKSKFSALAGAAITIVVANLCFSASVQHPF